MYKNGEKFNSTKDSKVYVSYTPIKYTIIFKDYNSYIGEENLPASIECTYDVEVELPATDYEYSPDTDKSNVYKCNGWCSSLYSSKLYAGGEKVKNLCTIDGGTVTLKPNFYKVGKSKVVFCPTGYTWLSSNKTLYYENGQKIDTSEIPEATKTGYSCDGWYVSTDSEETIIDFTTYTVTESVYFCPKFSLKSFTVTFESDYGTVPNSKTLDYATYVSWSNHNYNTSSYEISEKQTGYTFDGWKNSSGEKVTSLLGIEEDITLTAIWNAWTGTLHFYSNGGQGEMNSAVFTYGEKQALPKCSFYKQGYKFIGWGNDGKTVYWADGATYDFSMTQNNIEKQIYAIWEPLSTQIKIDVKSLSSRDDILLLYVPETSSFNASFDDATEFSWFVDGEEVENFKSAYFSSYALSEGLHTIMVTSEKDGKIYSGTLVVNVIIS